jgi:hypothetical protein
VEDEKRGNEGFLGLVPNPSIGSGTFAFAFLVYGAHVFLIHNFAVIFRKIRMS